MDARGVPGSASSSDGQPDCGGARISLAFKFADEGGAYVALSFFGEAAKLGIASNRAVRYECASAGTMLNFACMSESIKELRECDAMPENWKVEIENYHTKKNRKGRS